MKISVIIPALNEAKGILESLHGLEKQQGEFEIIVVDGCSIDGTADVARRYARVINSEKRGRAMQMNIGAHHACGEVLVFPACRFVSPSKCRFLAKTAQNRPGDADQTTRDNLCPALSKARHHPAAIA